MTDEFSHLNDEESLKAENEYLKMKLMLEEGAQFYATENGEKLPTPLENIFLRNILAFEKELRLQKKIKIADKLGNPQHFRPATEISDLQIDNSWRELEEYLNRHGLALDVCSPNVKSRELYRFVLEELFQLETEDIRAQGWTTTFIYDEFYPDAHWEATRTATNDCIYFILEENPIEWLHHFQSDNIRLNGHYPLTADQLKEIVNRFKRAYDSLEVGEITSDECTILERRATVSGHYRLCASDGRNQYTLTGKWKVVLQAGMDFSCWFVEEIDIEGISF